MALDVILKVKEAEKKADASIKLANDKSKEILKKAQTDANDTYNSMIIDSKEKESDIITENIQNANCKAKDIFKNGEKEVQEILNISNEKKQNAVKLVVERIVNIHGNS